MATTTNYGWTTPDDTALVKDGASAIRTLGTSVDTTTKALNPSTTLGDVEYRSSTANTNTRLGIGTTGQVLTVAGGVPSWATPSSGGMTLISTTTLTGASVTLSSIPATYNDLFIVVRNFRPASDNQSLKYYFNGDTAANYRTQGGTNYATSGGAGTYAVTSMDTVVSNDNTTNNGQHIFNIYDYANTTTWKFAEVITNVSDSTTPTSLNRVLSYGAYNQTAAISSITFLAASGNMTAGSVLLYGVK